MNGIILISIATLVFVATAQHTSYPTCEVNKKDTDCMMEFMSLKMSQLAILQENIRHDQTRQHQEDMVLVQGIRGEISQEANELQGIRAEIVNATMQLQTTRDELSQARNDVSQATSLLENLQNDISQATTQLDSTREQLSQATSRLETVRDDVSQQTTILETIRSEQSKHKSQSMDLLETIEYKQSKQHMDTNALLNTIVALVSRPKDCKEVQRLGQDVRGIYKIVLSGDAYPIDVFCDMDTDGGGWTVFQRRQDGSVNFTRSWADYRDGFGNLDGEHWLGNKYIHALTAASAQEMRIELGSWEDKRVYARYGQFSVGSEADGFRLNVSAYSGTAGGDSLSYGGSSNRNYQNGMMFSTFDRDQEYPRNCANRYESGFWFNMCFKANLNGPYRPSSSVEKDWHGIIWNYYKGGSYSLKFTELKMRPVSI